MRNPFFTSTQAGKRYQRTRRAVSLHMGMALLLTAVLLAACGDSTTAVPAPATTPSATFAPARTAIVTVAPPPTPTASPPAPTTSAAQPGSTLVPLTAAPLVTPPPILTPSPALINTPDPTAIAANRPELAYNSPVEALNLSYEDVLLDPINSQATQFAAFTTTDTPEKVANYYTDKFKTAGYGVAKALDAGQYQVMGTAPNLIVQIITEKTDKILEQRNLTTAARQQLKPGLTIVITLYTQRTVPGPGSKVISQPPTPTP